MSIRETVVKVKETEEKAERIVAEAREWSRREVDRARARRLELLAEARRAAEESVEKRRDSLRREASTKARQERGSLVAEREGLAAAAEKNTAGLLDLAADLFLSQLRSRRL